MEQARDKAQTISTQYLSKNNFLPGGKRIDHDSYLPILLYQLQP
jgi:hypothetical protein